VVTQAGHDGVQFFEGDKPTTVTQFVLVDSLSQFVYVFIFRVVGIAELPTFDATIGTLFPTILTTILKSDSLLLGNLVHKIAPHFKTYQVKPSMDFPVSCEIL